MESIYKLKKNVGDSDPDLSDGLKGPRIESATILINVRKDHDSYKMQKNNMKSGTGNFIYGEDISTGPAMSILPGFPTFSTYAQIHRPKKHANVPISGTFSGLSTFSRPTSHHMESDIRFMGFPNEAHTDGISSDSKMDIASFITGGVGTLNTGSGILSEGDIVRYEVPYYNVNTVEGSLGVYFPKVLPDKTWCDKHNFSKKTKNIILQSEKITPKSMLETHKMVAMRALRFLFLDKKRPVTGEDADKDPRYFPLGNHLDKNGRVTMRNFTGNMNYDNQFMYHSILNMQRLIPIILHILLENNVIMNGSGVPQAETEKKTRKDVIEYACTMLGYYQTERMKQVFKNENVRTASYSATEKFLALLYPEHGDEDVEKVVRDMFAGMTDDPRLRNILQNSGKAARLNAASHHLHEMRNVVGSCIRRSGRGKRLDLALGYTYIQ